jgi:hypothetical protein
MAAVAGDFQVAATADAQVPCVLLDPTGEPVDPVQDYLPISWRRTAAR